MRRRIGIFMFFLMIFLGAHLFPAVVSAAGSARFYVQTSETGTDKTIGVTVYLADAKNMGGVEAELLYDASKVSFVDARLGTSLETKLSDVYHDEEESKIKYVALYEKAQNPHGALMRVTFRLKEGEAYQPTLHVLGVVDDSDEVASIPFSVVYQHADGTWQEQPDTSGAKADEKVIQQAVTEYGSKEDIKEAENGNAYAPKEEEASGANDGGEMSFLQEQAGEQQDGNTAARESEAVNDADEKKTDKKETGLFVLIGAAAVIAAAGAAAVIWYVRKKSK